MGFANYYLDKHTENKIFIKEKPNIDLKLVITIPCYNEDKVIHSLESIYRCCKPNCSTDVILCINYPEDASEGTIKIHKGIYDEVNCWIASHQLEKLNFYAIFQPLPVKTAGVGLARKLAMDEAVRRFDYLNNPNGIIAGFDADSTCDENYLVEIVNFFEKNPRANGCSIRFEHPLHGNDFDPIVYQSITLYELYLRYYIEGLRYAQFPYSFHTIGSSFAVKAEAYCKQGGMNKRKAGEDFYFLHKIIVLGNYFELNSTKVIPSPRPSNRVPFGTGAAIQKMLNGEDDLYYTFNPQVFIDLLLLTSNVNKLYRCSDLDFENIIALFSDVLRSFLISRHLRKEVESMNTNSSSLAAFVKRFYNWFNGLMVLQYLNEAHVQYYSKVPVENASNVMFKAVFNKSGGDDALGLLIQYREVQSKD